jgi:phosphatidylserine decarboxylase
MQTLLFNESMDLVAMCILLIHMFPKFKSVLIGILCVLVYLYRVPNRPSITGDPTRIVSPCDGTVLDIIDLPNGFTQIIIYLSILDVHAQWFPTDGTVHETVYTPGKFNLAHILEKSDYNEKVTTILETPYGQVRINQIAGQVARRIVNWSRPGQCVNRGDLMGMIKLSSRVDLFLPTSKYSTCIRMGSRVFGNKTIIGNWN